MKRDQFNTSVRQKDGGPPIIDISYEGPANTLDEQLTRGDDQLTASDLDAAFRLRETADDTTSGVFGLTHRLTGAYLLEVNADAEAMAGLVSAAREADDDASYRVRIRPTDENPIDYEMSALLVYNSDGELLRKRSLIPSGVEL